MNANGLTLLQLRETIANKLSLFMSNPEVTIILEQINGFNVFVGGEVERTGIYTLKNDMTLFRFLMMVGIKYNSADIKNAYLVRGDQVIAVNIYDLIVKKDLKQDIKLISNDAIFVPDNFTSHVNIIGEVKDPKIITYRENMTILDIILLAGGLTEYAKPGNTKLLRKNGDELKQITIKLDDIIQKGKMETNIIIEPGDTIIVPLGLF